MSRGNDLRQQALHRHSQAHQQHIATTRHMRDSAATAQQGFRARSRTRLEHVQMPEPYRVDGRHSLYQPQEDAYDKGPGVLAVVVKTLVFICWLAWISWIVWQIVHI